MLQACQPFQIPAPFDDFVATWKNPDESERIYSQKRQAGEGGIHRLGITRVNGGGNDFPTTLSFARDAAVH